MYGLPQAGMLHNNSLNNASRPMATTKAKQPCFWRHNWQPICFALFVDDFVLKYVAKAHADHLIPTLKGHYDISMDWTGQHYIELTLPWSYRNRLVHLTMPGYCEQAGQCIHHPKPNKPQH
eukprot:CCRYP_017713-RA/>CCRYP_017713-RA protein AED:0.39 eAED:0.39 QI:0/-1/0/1/-1/0/1/0/120